MNNFSRGQQIRNYVVERELGRGAFGITYLSRNMSTGQQVAIKTIDLTLSVQKGTPIKVITEEIDTLIDLSRNMELCTSNSYPSYMNVRKNLACYYEAFLEKINGSDIVFIVTEYIDGSPLETFIKSNSGTLPPSVLWPLFAQLLDGLKYIHGSGYAHRDIKPENILITPDYVIKYIDFGLACVGACKLANCDNICKGKAGTPLYMPPEFMQGNYVSSLAAAQAHDIWSLGVLMFEMANGYNRFPYESTQIVNGKLAALSINDIMRNIMSAPQNTSGYARDDGRTNIFIMSLLVNNWNLRPTIITCEYNFNTLITNRVWTGQTLQQAAPQQAGPRQVVTQQVIPQQVITQRVIPQQVVPQQVISQQNSPSLSYMSIS